QGGDAFGGGAGSGQRRDRWNASGHSGAADGLLIEERVLSVRRVDDELNAIAFNQVNHVWTTLFYFIHAVASHTGFFDYVGGSASSDQFEPHIHKFARNIRNVWLVVVSDADEDASLSRQLLSGSDL